MHRVPFVLFRGASCLSALALDDDGSDRWMDGWVGEKGGRKGGGRGILLFT